MLSQIDRLARHYWLAAAALIAMLATVQVITIRGETATWDEPVYLAAGYSYWTTGRYAMNPEHPPLAKLFCALPLLVYDLRLDTQSPEWRGGNFVMVGNLFLYRNTISPDQLLFAGRMATIVLTLLFASYVAWWTRRRFGPAAGLFAVALFAFDPNIIAHGRYGTNDLMLALFIFTTCTLWIEYLIEPRWRWLLLTGVNLGMAVASKFSALYLPLVLVVMGGAFAWRYPKRLIGALSVVGVLSVLVLAVLYAPDIANSRGSLGDLTLLSGLERQFAHNADGHPAYLLGRVSNQGWWYYFPVAFAVKTPVATLAGVALMLVFLWRSPRRWLLLAVVFPAVVYFGLSLFSHIDIGIRYLLPVYPFLYAAMGCVFSEGRALRRAGAVIVLAAAIESAAVYPDYLAFFNIAAGGPNAGPKYLLDSNLDWGQDFKKLGRYLQKRGTPDVCLAFFANVDFPYYGIHPRIVPEGPAAEHPDCVIAMSATVLFGQYVGPERFAWLRAHRPEAIIGHSIYVYDLRR